MREQGRAEEFSPKITGANRKSCGNRSRTPCVRRVTGTRPRLPGASSCDARRFRTRNMRRKGVLRTRPAIPRSAGSGASRPNKRSERVLARNSRHCGTDMPRTCHCRCLPRNHRQTPRAFPAVANRSLAFRRLRSMSVSCHRMDQS